MPSFSSILLLVLLQILTLFILNSAGEMTNMEDDELSGLFEVMGSLLDDPTWAQVHPQPCTNTPWPGVQCELMAQEDADQNSPQGDENGPQGFNPTVFHVTKIHVGTDILTPPCKPTASLSSRGLMKLPYLKTLSLFNCFNGTPFSLSSSLFQNNSLLQHLSLVSNPSLEGSIPSSLGHIQTLTVLSLSQNKLTGEIPQQISALINLQQLDLSYNHLTGSIPQEIGKLKSLTIFDLSYNMIGGQIPSSLGQLQSLQKIDLGYNDLSGRVPEELGNLSRLVLFDVSHNFLTGPLPESLSGLKQLEYMVFQDNPINTGIPLFIGSLGRLKVLSFSRCGLMGQILITSLSLLKNLTALSLDNNSLNGTVPSNIGSVLPNLEQLNLSHNQLSGELLVSQEFVKRVGKRLDIRGNNGLCIKNNTLSGVKSPVSCLSSRSRTAGGNKSSWCNEDGDEDHKDECGNMNSNLYESNWSTKNHHGFEMLLLMIFLLL